MHWDVVEVKPEPQYCLFVRFKDGLTGRVRLRREELTGVLAPLRDERFFVQVDSAPDAMYAQVASQLHEPHETQQAGPGKSRR